MDILQAIGDDRLFRPWFREPDTWRNWFVVLKAMYGLPLDRKERRAFKKLAGGRKPPKAQVRELFIVAGRRAAKTFMAALNGVFLASSRDYLPHLQPGERAVVLILAVDRSQARVCLNYVKALIDGVPSLRKMVIRETAEEIELNNGTTICVHSNDYRSIRGRTLAACICDEAAFWRSGDSANPDLEVYRAIQPGLATIPNSLLMVISSPYSRRGLLWEKFKEYYGRDGDTLVIQAPTELLNPTIDKAIIARAFEDDPASASAEWGAQFRSDIESFIDRDVVEAAVASGVAEIPPAAGIRYLAFVDPSGGSSDSMTLAIAHNDDGTAVLDCLRESKPPFSPDAVVTEFAETLKSYGVRSVTGDRYAGEWPREKFRDAGITYDLTDKVKSAIYLDTLPMLNSGRVRLLENKRLITQLCALERRTSRGGKDSIDHPPRAHDDVANSACGALVLAGAKRKMVDFTDDDYFVGRPLASSLGEFGPISPIN